jgi:hypothetical protein
MKHRPTILILIGCLLGAMALSAPLHVMIVDNLGPSDLPEVFSRLGLFQWLLFSLGIVSSVLVLQASPLICLVLPSLTLIVVIHHIRHWLAHDISWVNASLATAGFLALNVPLLHPSIMSLIRSPDRRWWRVAPRRLAEAPIFLGGALKGTLRSKTYEISETGAFIVFPAGPPATFQVDEIVSVSVTLGALKQLRCTGRVVRIVEVSKDRYPRGLAIEFDSLTWEQKKDLKRYIAG